MNKGATGQTRSLHLVASYYIAFLFIISISTYYYIIFHGDFISLADNNLLNFLLNQPPLDLKKVFLPSGPINYYRPLVELSYRLDYRIWLDIASGYYLTNVIHHTQNVMFVFLIGRLIGSKTSIKNDREAEGIEPMQKAIASGFSCFPSLTLASIKFNKGDIEGGEKIIQKVIHDFSRNPESHKFLAERYLSTIGDRENSLAFYRKALIAYKNHIHLLLSDDLDANLKIARLYWLIKQKDKSVPFLKIVATTPDSNMPSEAARLLNQIQGEKSLQ